VRKSIKALSRGKINILLAIVLLFLGLGSALLLTIISNSPRQQASAAVTVYDCSYDDSCPNVSTPTPTTNTFAETITLNDPNCEIDQISLQQAQSYLSIKAADSKYQFISQGILKVINILPNKFKHFIIEKTVNNILAVDEACSIGDPKSACYYDIGYNSLYGGLNLAYGSWAESQIVDDQKVYTSMNLTEFNNIYNIMELECNDDDECDYTTTNPPDLTRCPTGATSGDQCDSAEYVGIQYYCDGGGASSECFDNPKFVTQSMINTSYNICLGSTSGTCSISLFNGLSMASQVENPSGGGGTTGTTFADVTVPEPALPAAGATPTPTPVLPYDPPTLIHGYFYVDEGATIDPVSEICEYEPIYHDRKLEAEVEDMSIIPEGEAPPVIGDNYYQIVTKYRSTYQVNLNLSSTPNANGDIYACSCPSPESIPGNTDISQCAYYNVTANNLFADFFLKQYNLLNGGWWQVAGGSVYALNNIDSNVPYEACASESGCYAGIMASNPLDTAIKDTTGLAMVNLGNIYSHRTDTDGEGNYVMVPESRTSDDGDNARALGVSIPQQNYAYFFNKIGGKVTVSGSNRPPSSGIYIYNNDVSITDSNAWSVGDDESLIVFVNGNLNFDDGGDGNKLTDVSTNNGFLVFIVSGNITISSNVGHEDHSVAASVATANLEGVFVTDGSITTQSRGEDTPDKKFIGSGTFVGYSGISLNRDFSDGGLGAIDNNIYAAETFLHRPDLLLNTPIEMKSANYHWQEIAPSS
jgi:hypothetical protein